MKGLIDRCQRLAKKWIYPDSDDWYERRKLETILKEFNKINDCKILSTDVALKALSGRRISVGKNSIIDEYSKIGAYTGIGKDCYITKTNIGRYVAIGPHVKIGLGEHITDNVALSGLLYPKTNLYDVYTRKECVIGHDVWLGTDVIVCRGVRIGNGAIIGANSVVTKDIPNYAIAVGCPAKVIRYRFSAEIIDKIVQSGWWNMELDEARKIISDLEKEIKKS